MKTLDFITKNVRLIRQGSKIETRRPVKFHGLNLLFLNLFLLVLNNFRGRSVGVFKCPYGAVGDVVEVVKDTGKEKKNAHLKIKYTDIRIERIQDISPNDLRAEGLSSITELSSMWDEIYKDKKRYSWAKNPWVWVLTFEVDKTKESNDRTI